MNAFLAIQIDKLPIKSLMEISKKNYGLALWESGIIEHALMSSPKESPNRKMYEDQLSKRAAAGSYNGELAEKGLMYISSTEHGIEIIMDQQAVLFEYIESVSR